MIQRRSSQLPVAFALSLSMLVLAGLMLILVVSSVVAPTHAAAAPLSQSAPLTSTLVINEVFRSSTTANDYMELYNGSSTQPVSLSGLVIRNSMSETSLSTLYTNTIQPRSYLPIGPALFNPPRTTLVGNGLQASDYLALASTVNDQVPIDLVNWADPNPNWYYFVNYQNYFLRPPAAMPAPDGLLSLSRYPNGYDTDTNAEWYQLTKSAGYANPSPTPGAITPTATPTAGCDDRYEPDNSSNQAKPLDQNTDQVHTLCRSSGGADADWFYFTAVGGKQYTMLTKDLTGPVDTVMTLYDSSLNVLAFNDDYSPGQGLASRIDYTFAATARYYLQVRDARNNSGLGYQYTISLIATGALPSPTLSPTVNPNATGTPGACYDIYEPDGVPETAKLINIQTSQHHTICPIADADWERFYARAGKVYTIQTQNLGIGLDTYMYLFDSDATKIIAQNDDGGLDNLSSRIDFYPVRDDWYYVQVKNAGDIGGAEMTYDLSLNVVPGAPVPPGTATSIIAPVVTATAAGTRAVEPTKPPVPTPTQASVPPTPTPIPTRLAQIVPTAPAGPTPPPQVVVVPTEEVPGLPNTGHPGVPRAIAKPPQSQPQNSLKYAPMWFRVFYDANGNRGYDKGEGIRGIQVQFLKNQAEATGKLVTGNDGSGRLTLPILDERIYIPYLGINMPLADFPERELHSLWLTPRKLPDRVP